MSGNVSGKFAARVRLSEEDVRRRLPYALAAEIYFQNAFDLVDPRHFDGGTVMQYDNGVRLRRGDFLHQPVVALRQPQMISVVSPPIRRNRAAL